MSAASSFQWNLPELVEPAPAAAVRTMPNVVEMAEPEPAAGTSSGTSSDKARIAELERKVSLLTEAVLMFLALKSEAEHTSLIRSEPLIGKVPLSPFGSAYLPSQVSLALSGMMCVKPGKSTNSNEEFAAAFEVLQTDLLKTDSLIAALHKE